MVATAPEYKEKAVAVEEGSSRLQDAVSEEDKRIEYERLIAEETAKHVEIARKMFQEKMDSGTLEYGTQDVLSAPPRPGFDRRFVADKNDGRRIQQMQNEGWTIVSSQNLDPLSVIVGKPGKTGVSEQVGDQINRNAGAGVQLKLMEIPTLLREKKLAIAQANVVDPVDEIRALEQKDVSPNPNNKAGFYEPGGVGTGFNVSRPN